MVDRIRVSATAFAFLCFVTSAQAFDINDLAKGVNILNDLTRGATPNTASPPAAPQRPVTPDTPRPSSAAIREIQALLAQLAYDRGPADGLMGRRTTSAIRAFESDRGLAVTGVPDDRILASLREAARSQAYQRKTSACINWLPHDNIKQLTQKIGAERRLYARTDTRPALLERNSGGSIMNREPYRNAILLESPDSADAIPSLSTPLSMPRLFADSAACPPHEVMALIMLYGDDGRVAEYRQAVPMPAQVATIAERRKSEAATAVVDL